MPTRFIVVAILALGILAPVIAAQQTSLRATERATWMKYEAPGLELYSNASPERARWLAAYCAHLLTVYEQVGLFPRPEASPLHATPAPLQVIHFRDLSSYLPFRITANAPAFHIGGRGRSLVLIQDTGDNLGEVAAHEFFHVYTDKVGRTLPVWAAEGLADYYSTMRRETADDGTSHLRIGEPVARHERMLSRAGTSPVNSAGLFAVNSNTRHRGSESAAPGFYAESWLLAHMLLSKSPWRERLPEFLDALGQPGSAEALAQVYGADTSALDAAAAAYVAAGRYKTRVVPLPGLAENDVREVESHPWELRLLLADVLAYRGRADAARTAYEALRNEFPNVPDIRESLANLALEEFSLTEAARHLSDAAELGSRSGEVYHRLATLRCGMYSEDPLCMGWLQRALAYSQPNREFLTYAIDFALNTKQYTQALEWAQSLPTQPGKERFDVLQKQVYALYHLEDFAAARAKLALAREQADTPGQHKMLSDLERAIAEREEFTLQMALFRDATNDDDSPRQQALAQLLNKFAASPHAVIERVRLAEIRCQPTGISLLVDGPHGRRTLNIENPMDLMVLEGTHRLRELDLTCGPAGGQPLQVGYFWNDATLVGTLRILQFLPLQQ